MPPVTFLADISEFPSWQLERELAERRKRHAAGVCSHCMRDHNTAPHLQVPAASQRQGVLMIAILFTVVAIALLFGEGRRAS